MKILPVLLLTLCACDKDEEEHYDRTPDGHRIRLEGPWRTISTGLRTKEDVYADFDFAVKRAALELERDNGIPYDRTIAWARRIEYTLYDHLYFEYGGGYFHGMYWPYRQPLILAAYWYYESNADPAAIPADAPLWTIVYGNKTGLWYWGVLDPAKMIPVLTHELAWGLGTEHKPNAGDPAPLVIEFTGL